jgi:hypothetical protein
MAHIPVRHPSGDLRPSQSAILPMGQRFGSALNPNIHFHMLFLDGVYVERPGGSLPAFSLGEWSLREWLA